MRPLLVLMTSGKKPEIAALIFRKTLYPVITLSSSSVTFIGANIVLLSFLLRLRLRFREFKLPPKMYVGGRERRCFPKGEKEDTKSRSKKFKVRFLSEKETRQKYAIFAELWYV